MKWASIPSQTTVEVLSYPECPLPIIKRRGVLGTLEWTQVFIGAGQQL